MVLPNKYYCPIIATCVLLSVMVFFTPNKHSQHASSQEVGGTLIGENGLVVMARAEKYQLPFHSRRSRRSCEPSSPQQPPLR